MNNKRTKQYYNIVENIEEKDFREAMTFFFGLLKSGQVSFEVFYRVMKYVNKEGS